MFTGSVAFPVSADTVISPLAPRFTVATAKAPVPLVPATSTMTSLVNVAVRATMSGIGVVEAENSKVFNPELIGAGRVLAQSKLNRTSVGAIGALGVKAKTKLCAEPAGISTGAFGEPVTAFVGGLVVK